MKLGIVLPSFLYNNERKTLADLAFRTLAGTKPLSEPTKLLLLVKEGTAGEYVKYLDSLANAFTVELVTDEGLKGTEQTLAYGTTRLFAEDREYVTWMGDDAAFHSEWLLQLEALINRHKEAKSWSVYHSAYKIIHKTVREEAEDTEVTSICGHCLTLKKEEWDEWGIDWKTGAWNCPYGDTLDMVHQTYRLGERWVTTKSYVQHTGRQGVHCTLNIPEYALDFQFDQQG